MSNPFNPKIYSNHPPVPQPLQEALKDYPELIAELQASLEKTGVEPLMSKDQRYDMFESALGLLENRLGGYMSDAAQEVRRAETTGDGELIAKAKARKRLMSDCRMRQLSNGVSELIRFFE